MLTRTLFHFTRSKLLILNVTVVLLALLCLYSNNSQAETSNSAVEIRQLVQLAEYIAVDYVEAVDDGQVLNDGEYQEMLEFSQFIIENIVLIPENAANTNDLTNDLEGQARSLQIAIQTKQDIETIRQMSRGLRGALLTLIPQLSLPDRLLPKATVANMFQSRCIVCHGQAGRGDGELAAEMEPAPTNFTDKDRALNRSLLGLYDAISNGIDDTAMPTFGDLTEQQRWSLAFYVGGLAFQTGSSVKSDTSDVSLQQLVNHNPMQLAAEHPEISLQEIENLRANPASLFDATAVNPLKTTRDQLLLAQEAYQRGDYQTAQALAVSAYLDGFELIENSLNTQDKTLLQTIEAGMMAMRQLLKQPQPAGEVEAAISQILAQLDEAERLLSESTLSDAALFSASLVILLREGLEALLVIIALVTVLVRTGRRDGLRYVHFGWIAALMAGVATWAVAQSLINISGASREVMEGVAALLAALVLLYVGIWMHSKTHAAQWQVYIQQNINKHLTSGTLWGLVLLAFIAVYREVFETVLFYQALLTQAAPIQFPAIFSGFVFAVILLSGLTWVLVRYSVKLPIAKFFSITTYLLLTLAFILIGKAVLALQEAALIGITPLPVSFEIDWLGVKSTWQGVLAQLSVLLAFLIFLMVGQWQNKNTPVNDLDASKVTSSKPD
ncbi:MAG: cytochrome c/FTR1 family iron permease [Gammaproteobacteria bacterium]|nr:cytochrome c/FTR1 family iron permease [Gammaproteobacteria bacterium]